MNIEPEILVMIQGLADTVQAQQESLELLAQKVTILESELKRTANIASCIVAYGIKPD